MLFQLFAVLPRVRHAPTPDVLRVLAGANVTGVGLGAQLAGSGATELSKVAQPPWAVWARLPTPLALAVDAKARVAFLVATSNDSSTCHQSHALPTGWW